jgi:hypothetical protein
LQNNRENAEIENLAYDYGEKHLLPREAEYEKQYETRL